MVIVKTDDKNRNTWPLGIVAELFEGRDGVVRGVRVRVSSGFLERPVQHLFPLELSCDKPEQRNWIQVQSHSDPKEQLQRKRL